MSLIPSWFGKEVEPGKSPLGESVDWFKQCWMAVRIASVLSLTPVGSPPKLAGVTLTVAFRALVLLRGVCACVCPGESAI